MALSLREVREFLLPLQVRWYDLGLELDVDEEQLDTIKYKEKDDPSTCLREMLKIRIKTLTWNVIAQALRAKVINEKELSSKGIYVLYKSKSLEC